MASLSYCGSWPWAGPSPLATLVLIARSPFGEVPAHPPPGSPRLLGAATIQLRRGSNAPLIYQGHFEAKNEGQKQNFSEVFSHVLQSPLNRILYCPDAHAFSLGYFLHALAENDTSVDPTALRLGQRIESMA
ncbi:MAG: hypothetical protein PWQ08_674 [Clostridiales bacterium]|nr:hypothetical protein [Clostridiales bacterium]